MMQYRESDEDPTSRGDNTAAKMRAFYEANKPKWWQRDSYRRGTADNLMLGLLNVALAEYVK